MKKPLLYLAILIAALSLIKHFFFPVPKEDGGPKGGPGGGMPPAAVEGFVVHPSSLDNAVQVTGSLRANESVDLRPEVTGRVTEIRFKEGSEVSKGDLLVKLEDHDLQAKLKQNLAQQNLANAKLMRLKELFKVQGVSQEELDNAQNEYDALAAEREVLLVQKFRTEIYAPFNGTIGLRSVSLGSVVSPTQIIASIQQLEPMKVEFSVPERVAAGIRDLTKIKFTVEGDTVAHEGTVYATEPAVDADTRSMLVRAQTANPTHNLIPGRFVKVDLRLSTINDALMVPTQAIVPVLKGQQVFVSRGGKAAAVPVKLGVRNDRFVQVVDGISAGDTVITTGVMGLKPDADLKFIHVNDAASNATH